MQCTDIELFCTTSNCGATSDIKQATITITVAQGGEDSTPSTPTSAPKPCANVLQRSTRRRCRNQCRKLNLKFRQWYRNGAPEVQGCKRVSSELTRVVHNINYVCSLHENPIRYDGNLMVRPVDTA